MADGEKTAAIAVFYFPVWTLDCEVGPTDTSVGDMAMTCRQPGQNRSGMGQEDHVPGFRSKEPK
jgi:hypothetical protein